MTTECKFDPSIDRPKKKKLKTSWRPAMAYSYMVIVWFDFIIFPIMFSMLQYYMAENLGETLLQWQPITLQAGGFFHIAMGAIIGATAYGRTQEKINGVADDYESISESMTPTGN